MLEIHRKNLNMEVWVFVRDVEAQYVLGWMRKQ